MNEIFKTLRDKFPFLSLILKGDMEFVGIVHFSESQDTMFFQGQRKVKVLIFLHKLTGLLHSLYSLYS